MVVSQSWSEIHKVNEQVRIGFKAQKLIGEIETTVTTLERVDLTDAQKRDKRFYNADSLLVFNRNSCGFKAGDAGKLQGITEQTFACRIRQSHPACSVQRFGTNHGLPA